MTSSAVKGNSRSRHMSHPERSRSDFGFLGRRSSLGSLGVQVYSCMYCIYNSNSFHQLEKHMKKHAEAERAKKASENQMPEYVNYPAYKKNHKTGGQGKYKNNAQSNLQGKRKIHGSLQHFSDGISLESTRKMSLMTSQSMCDLITQEQYDQKPVRKVKKSSKTKVRRVSQSTSNLRSTNLKNLSVSTMSLKRVGKHHVKKHHASQPRIARGHSPKKSSHYSKNPRNTRVSRTSVTSLGSSHKETDQKRSKEVYLCTQCDSRCKSKFSLKMHMFLHVFDKKSKIYKCPDCGQQFNFKESLKKHKMVHSWLPNVNANLQPEKSKVKVTYF